LGALATKYGSWESAWQNTRRDFRLIDPEIEWEKMRVQGVDLILKDDANFPALLKEIYSCPWGLYFRGALQSLEQPSVAIVGTRNATNAGLSAAEKFAKELSGVNITVVSGLALGIDTAAHRGALAGGSPTFAVLACGADIVYPAQNQSLADSIIKAGGAVISEYPPGSPALPYRFLERNRIISGLTKISIIIEAPEQSGALATARYAVEQNRDVGAIPGPLNHPNYKGNYSLLKSGAALITETADILEALNLGELTLVSKKTPIGLNDLETQILNILKNAGEALTVDKIIELAKVEPANAQQTLTRLIIKDIIKESSGRYELQ